MHKQFSCSFHYALNDAKHTTLVTLTFSVIHVIEKIGQGGSSQSLFQRKRKKGGGGAINKAFLFCKITNNNMFNFQEDIFSLTPTKQTKKDVRI